MSNLVSLVFLIAEICVFTQTDRRTDVAQSTRQVILSNNNSTLPYLLLPVTYVYFRKVSIPFFFGRRV